MAASLPSFQPLTSPSSIMNTTSPPWRRRVSPQQTGRTRARTSRILAAGKGRRGEEEGRGKRRADEEDDEIPQVVFDRMVKRIIVAVGLPMGSGVGLLYVMNSLKDSGVWDVPVWVPFASTLLSFGTSALGIAYGTLSTSWEPEREGSLLGWDEAARNWPKLWEEEEGKKS
ncbi:transmembrane protein, putative (DUF3464) [Wolffia australiana]